MKTFQKISLLLALALAFNLRAATNDNARFSGTVVDAQGNPVAGATVVCYQYPSRTSFGRVEMEAKQRATTDGRGAFEFPAFHGEAVVLVTKDGIAPGWRVWYNAPEEPQKIVLSSSSMLAGVVVDDAGKPVADAEVWVLDAINKTPTDYGQQSFVSGKIARELFSARTSADGKFRIENFPADAQAILLAKKNGKALRPTASLTQYNELPFHAGQEDITLTLDPAGSVAGKVVVRGTGQPLAHAVVGLEPATPEMRYLLLDMGTIVSAADGSFQIPGVSAGSYQLMATFTNEPIADWVANPVPVKVAAGQSVPDLQIQAYKGGIVEVTVRGKNNHEPVANAGVSVTSEDFNRNRSSSTGTNGVAYFRLSSGQFNVYANKQDWSQAQTQTTVTEGQTTQVTIELGEPSKVAGIVRDASGAPVAGASVGVFPNDQGNDSGTKTDANGHYELSWQKPSWAGMSDQKFHLLARHLERKLAAMQEMEETTTNLDLTLKPAMSVSGRVQDIHGKAVTNVMAYIMLHLENSSFTISRRQEIHSDEQGRIQAEALPMGERYGLYASANGYGNAQQEMDAADPKAAHYDFPPLVLKIADRKLAGRVLGADGKPVAGAQIWMRGEGQPNRNDAATDVDGRFVYDAVCEGAVSVSANFKNFSGSAEAMGGDTNVVIRFDARNRVVNAAAPQTLTGTVYDSSGKPAVGARVVVTPSFGAASTAKTDAKGEYSVNWQAQPGMRDAKYFAVARDVERNLAAMEAIDTNKTRMDLRLGPGLSISGTVQDAKGASLARANINLNMVAGNMGGMVEYQAIKVNSDGTFTIPALPVGQQYRVRVTTSGYGSANKNVGKTQSQTNSLQLSPFKLKPADRQLAGQVLGTDNKPLSGAQVNINGNGQPSGNSRTDATGYFKFKVCDGPIQVFAYSPSGAGVVNSGTTYARGGDTNVVVKIGARQQPKIVPREIPLKPQAWTLSAIATWPAHHKTGTIILLSLQAVVLLGTGGGIFWFTRKRG
jgi:protocatechuate 3,4-dioxygenase beta subunit